MTSNAAHTDGSSRAYRRYRRRAAAARPTHQRAEVAQILPRRSPESRASPSTGTKRWLTTSSPARRRQRRQAGADVGMAARRRCSVQERRQVALDAPAGAAPASGWRRRPRSRRRRPPGCTTRAHSRSTACRIGHVLEQPADERAVGRMAAASGSRRRRGAHELDRARGHVGGQDAPGVRQLPVGDVDADDAQLRPALPHQPRLGADADADLEQRAHAFEAPCRRRPTAPGTPPASIRRSASSSE